jgi:competence protein ComEA
MNAMRENLQTMLREKGIGLLRRCHLSRAPRGVVIALGVLLVSLVLVALVRWWPSEGRSGFSLETGDVTTRQSSTMVTNQADTDALRLDAGSSDADVVYCITVHVAGAVVNPGVYQLDEGARAVDALEAAGGATGDAALSSINLARVLAEAEQVYIPTVQEVATEGAQGSVVSSGASTSSTSSVGVSTSGPSGSSTLVNINTATLEQLESLPGVGPSTARKIVNDRESNGPFSSTKDLQRVSGIGEKKYAAIADLICV